MDCFHPSALPVTLSLFLIWPVITLVYYGLTFRCLGGWKRIILKPIINVFLFQF